MSLKNSTFLDLKNLTFALIGREYLNTTAQFGRLVALWNQGAKRAYRASHYWDRHLVVGEPRTVTHGYVESTEDGFYIHDAGESAANGLYQYAAEYNNHNSYVLNSNSLSFKVTDFPANDAVRGTYKLDPTYTIGISGFTRGTWINQDNPRYAIAYDDNNTWWSVVDLSIPQAFNAPNGNPSPCGAFPWSAGWGAGITFGDVPEVVYSIERNASNNHWELVRTEGTTCAVIYKDGNGNTPSETAWEIVEAVQPPPHVHDLDNIDTFLRIYKQQPFEGSSVQEMDFHVKGGVAKLIGSVSDGDIVYITYKNEYTPDYTVDSNDGDEVPDEYMNYMAHYAAYTWQRSVEQNASENNFALSLGLVNQILEDELAKVEGQGIFNSNVARKFKTYRNYT
jgi:hypothetical protein